MMGIEIGGKVIVLDSYTDRISHASMAVTYRCVIKALKSNRAPVVLDIKKGLWLKVTLDDIIWFVREEDVRALSPLESLAIGCGDGI